MEVPHTHCGRARRRNFGERSPPGWVWLREALPSTSALNLLSKDPVAPIIPLHAACNDLGYRTTWDGESGCVLRHPQHGKLDVAMVAGCPELPEQEVVDLIRLLEEQRACKALKAITVFNMQRTPGCELDLPVLLGSHVGDLLGLEVELLKWVAGAFPYLDPERVSELVPALEVDNTVLPFNRRKRCQVEQAKGVMLHFFGGSKQWGAAPGRVSLSVDWQRGVDFDAVCPYLLRLAVKGKVERLVASMPQLIGKGPGKDLLFLKVCVLGAVAQAARDRDNVFVSLAVKPPSEVTHKKWYNAGLSVLGGLHIAEVGGLELFRDVSCGVASNEVDEVLDSVTPAVLGNDGRRNLEAHTSSWHVFEHLRRTSGVSATGLAKVLSVAWGDWTRDPEAVLVDGYERECLLLDLMEAEVSSGADEAKLARASSSEAFKSHVLADRKPYRSDCKVCLESRSRARRHARAAASGPVNTLSADIAGPSPAGFDVVKDARYALVTDFSQQADVYFCTVTARHGTGQFAGL